MEIRHIQRRYVDLYAIREHDFDPASDVVLEEKNRSIDSLSEVDAFSFTCFRKGQLKKLYDHLRIPLRFVIESRHTFTGEETLIISLVRIGGVFSTWGSMEHFFGGDSIKFGYMFAAFIDHVYRNFRHKITGDSMSMW